MLVEDVSNDELPRNAIIQSLRWCLTGVSYQRAPLLLPAPRHDIVLSAYKRCVLATPVLSSRALSVSRLSLTGSATQVLLAAGTSRVLFFTSTKITRVLIVVIPAPSSCARHLLTSSSLQIPVLQL